MPTYTLYYFNGRGRAEICRMLMAIAGVHYTDKRFEFNEWDKIRNDMPTMCVPVLDIDGKEKMPETMAIARYLAREHDLYGKTNMDMFKVDYIGDCLYEIMHDYMRYFHAKNGRFCGDDAEKNPIGVVDIELCDFEQYGQSWKEMTELIKTEMQTKYLETCKRILPFLERTLEMKNGGKEFFMGDQVVISYNRTAEKFPDAIEENVIEGSTINSD